MAQLGFRNSCVGNTANVDSTQLNPVGTTSFDQYGGEYVYLPGVASTVAGSWVTIGGLNAGAGTDTTALLTESSTGRVAVAMAATVASTWGWYQIKGWNSVALAGSNGTIVSGGGALASEVASGGTGRVVLGTGDSFGATVASFIYGAFSYSGQPDSDSAASGTPGTDLITVYLNYPFLAPLTAAI